MTWLPPRIPALFERASARRRRWLRVHVLAVLLLAPAALAQSGDEGEGVPEAREGSFPSLSGRFGLEPLLDALAAPDLADRVAAIQRLAGLGTPAAVHRLVNVALERRAQLEPQEWLTLVRVLAPHAREDDARVLLAQAMSQRPPDKAGEASSALFALVRSSAALALAASGSEPALRVLGAALRAGGPAAAPAADALLEHPPTALDALLSVPGEPSVELARWLGKLGDQRAFHSLREWVRGGSPDVRAAAAIALTELGALETVPLARAWLRSGLPQLERAALQILMLTQQPEAGAQLLQRLRAAPEEVGALSHALEFPAAELLRWASSADGAGPRRWALLGRIGGAAAVAELESALGRADAAFPAAQALSRSPGAEASAALARALEARRVLPLVVRAAALREWSWQEEAGALPARVAELQASQQPAERAAGAWASSLRGARAALAVLESGDAVRVEAAANNALCFDDQVLAAAARQLSAAAPGRARNARAFALLRPSGARVVTSELLESLVLEGGVAAPLALRALAARAEPRFQGLSDSYLAHPDPVLRAHAARGLGESPRAEAVGLLLQSFEFETDEVVRQAIVRALSLRRGPAVRSALGLAARLDASASVRAAAQLALSGVELRDPPPGTEALWAEAPRIAQRNAAPAGEQEAAEQPTQPAAASPAADAGAAPAAAASEPPAAPMLGAEGLLHVVPGLALPVFADAAGVAVVAGLDLEPLALRWQSSPVR